MQFVHSEKVNIGQYVSYLSDYMYNLILHLKKI
jgi:hypothetical protein